MLGRGSNRNTNSKAPLPTLPLPAAKGGLKRAAPDVVPSHAPQNCLQHRNGGKAPMQA